MTLGRGWGQDRYERGIKIWIEQYETYNDNHQELYKIIGNYIGQGVGGKIDGGRQVADTPTQLLDTHSLQVFLVIMHRKVSNIP